jgi:D-beta-D-heptose 7-phosphate kinase/D-beta-D-heptose 1-phosphate adenosyltransferase
MSRIMGEVSLKPEALLSRFGDQRILVIGDVMLDWFIWGSVSRISPEAPVPVVEVQEESRYPGGAANVARNMTPFGTRVDLSGLFGTDPNGELLSQTLSECGIGTRFCLQEEHLQTITKTRVVARHQQVVRIDREKRQSIPPALAETLIERIVPMLSDLDGIIIEDYGKGLITPELVSSLLARTAEHDHLTITVDPKPGNPIEWRGVTTVKPNRPEAFACSGIEDLHRDSGIDPLEDEPLLEAGEKLLEEWACRQVLLTLGEQGMLVFRADSEPVHLPARAREVFDVSGAGDTAIAIYTLGLCVGLGPETAAIVSNLASSIVVGKLGTSPIEREEFLESLQKEFSDGIPLA